jgi:hypothetical protein
LIDQTLLSLFSGFFGAWFLVNKGNREHYYKEKFTSYRQLQSAATELFLNGYLYIILDNDQGLDQLSKARATFFDLVKANILLLNDKVSKSTETFLALVDDISSGGTSKEALKEAHQNLLKEFGSDLGLNHLNFQTHLLTGAVTNRLVTMITRHKI